MADPMERGTSLTQGRHAWRSILCSAIAMSVGMNLLMSTNSLFLQPLATQFHWSRGQIGIGAAGLLLHAATAPFIGMLADRFGVRPVAAIGMAILAGAYIGLSLMTGYIAALYGLLLVAFLVGAATSAVVLSRPLVQEMSGHRGASLGLGLSLAQLIVMALVSVVQAIIVHYGWRTAYLFLAAMPGVVGLGALLLLPAGTPAAERRVVPPGHGPDATPDATVAEVLADLRFWILFFAILASMLGYGGLFGHFAPLLADRRIGPFDIGLVLSAMAGAAIAGRIVEGLLLDRIWPPLVAGLTYLLPIAGLVMLLRVHLGLPSAIAAGLLIGFGSGSETNQISFFTVRYFGLRAYSTVFGLLGIAVGIALAAGGALFGLIYDRTGSYDVALQTSIGGLVIAGILMFLTGLVNPAVDLRAGRVEATAL